MNYSENIQCAQPIKEIPFYSGRTCGRSRFEKMNTPTYTPLPKTLQYQFRRQELRSLRISMIYSICLSPWLLKKNWMNCRMKLKK
jgi:hypothetical protein